MNVSSARHGIHLTQGQDRSTQKKFRYQKFFTEDTPKTHTQKYIVQFNKTLYVICYFKLSRTPSAPPFFIKKSWTIHLSSTIFGSIRSLRNANVCLFVCLVKSVLQLTIFIFLSQVSLRSVSGYSQVIIRSLSGHSQVILRSFSGNSQVILR